MGLDSDRASGESWGMVGGALWFVDYLCLRRRRIRPCDTMRGVCRVLLAKEGPGWRVVAQKRPAQQSSNVLTKSPQQMAENHPSVLLAKSKALNTYGITLENVKEKTEQFYDWSRKEYVYKWVAASGVLVLIYMWWDCLEIKRIASVLGRKREYETALEARNEAEDKRTAGDRERVRQLLREFLKYHPRPTDDDLDLLRERCRDILAPQTLSASEVWEAHLDRMQQERLADRRAYERAHGLLGARTTTSAVKIEGTAPGAVLQMAPVPHMPDAAEQKRLDALAAKHAAKDSGAAMIERFLAMGKPPEAEAE